MPDLPPLPPHPLDDQPYPVKRNPDGSYWDELSRMVAERGMTIRQWREASRCEKCGHCSWNPDTDTDDTVNKPCPHGCCIVWCCAECGNFTSGMGAAGCPCDDGI